ncbi:CBU_0592 family membrane protein [Novosphingobium sp. KACC 22771]|uniref:CBU_0592 family membrane protein n=1 Tax=Novosphingobium sp. KACC 22771 TaxID=3025670 RepID=UPI0023654B9B|nr:permease [Novosphingobium sp. KACC 22771]WDF73869.1 permease [Novosphingobium sp. KACC 22771]
MSLITGIPEEIATACGFAGMSLCVFAYGYTTAFTGKAREPNPFVQHGANLAGALLLVVSLLVDTNVASLAMESLWAAIAFVGLIRAMMGKNA